MNRYCGHECKSSSDVSQTFYLLLDSMTFFDHYYYQQFNDALDIRIYLFNICLLILTIICRLSLNWKFCPFVTLTLIWKLINSINTQKKFKEIFLTYCWLQWIFFILNTKRLNIAIQKLMTPIFLFNLDFCATIRSSTPRAVNKFGIIGDIGNKEQVFQRLNSRLNYFFINCFNNNFWFIFSFEQK